MSTVFNCVIHCFSRWLRVDDFIHSVFVLTGGTIIGHIITMMTLPVITRIYSPSDFGVLAVFTAILATISVVACLRYEIAIPIADNDVDAYYLAVLSILSSLVISACVAGAVFVFPEFLIEVSGNEALAPYLWLIPLGVFFTGIYGLVQLWAIRFKKFMLISKSRVAQSAATSVTQVGSGLAIGATPKGLLMGHLANVLVGAIFLGWFFAFQKTASIGGGCKKLWGTAKKYKRFPKYSTWEALANSGGIQIPIIMIGTLATKSEAGYLLLALTIIQVPMSLFGGAIGQVYLSHSGDKHKQGILGEFTAEIFVKLVKVGTLPLLMIGMLSPFLFALVFGSDWERAGWLALWLTPWFIMQFLASPLSMALQTTGNQKGAFVLQLFGLIFRVGAVFIASKATFQPISEAYAISGFVFYFIYLIYIFKCVEVSVKQMINFFLYKA